MKTIIFASGMGEDNNVQAKGDVIFTFKLIIEKLKLPMNKIEVTMGIWGRAIEDREDREITILCENNNIKIDTIVGQHTIHDQYFKVYSKNRLVAQSGKTTIR